MMVEKIAAKTIWPVNLLQEQYADQLTEILIDFIHQSGEKPKANNNFEVDMEFMQENWLALYTYLKHIGVKDGDILNLHIKELRRKKKK